MPFEFPLESLLKLRRSSEQQQELKLQAATQQVMRVRRRIENIDKQTQFVSKQSAQSLEAGTTSAELRLLVDLTAAYRRQSEQLQKELLYFENLRNQEMARYQGERRKREILENLRTHSFEKYRRNLARQDQQRTDDLFLMRHARERHG